MFYVKNRWVAHRHYYYFGRHSYFGQPAELMHSEFCILFNRIFKMCVDLVFLSCSLN